MLMSQAGCLLQLVLLVVIPLSLRWFFPAYSKGFAVDLITTCVLLFCATVFYNLFSVAQRQSRIFGWQWVRNAAEYRRLRGRGVIPVVIGHRLAAPTFRIKMILIPAMLIVVAIIAWLAGVDRPLTRGWYLLLVLYCVAYLGHSVIAYSMTPTVLVLGGSTPETFDLYGKARQITRDPCFAHLLDNGSALPYSVRGGANSFRTFVDDEWFEAFKRVAADARMIVICYAGGSSCVEREVEWITTNNLSAKAIVYLSPSTSLTNAIDHERLQLMTMPPLSDFWAELKSMHSRLVER